MRTRRPAPVSTLAKKEPSTTTTNDRTLPAAVTNSQSAAMAAQKSGAFSSIHEGGEKRGGETLIRVTYMQDLPAGSTRATTNSPLGTPRPKSRVARATSQSAPLSSAKLSRRSLGTDPHAAIYVRMLTGSRPHSLSPYERRVIELLRNSKDKRARKLAKKRVLWSHYISVDMRLMRQR